MANAEQGDVLRIDGFKFPVVVVSNPFFNRSGDVIVCPIVPNAEEGPLHLFLEIEQTQGYILCEQVHYVNLRKRHYHKIGCTDNFFTMDLSDAVMSMFDYQTI